MDKIGWDATPDMILQWQTACPLSWKQSITWGAGAPVSPTSVLASMELKSYFARRFPYLATVPCDMFVMATGEPPDRATTKFGGLPYRPAGAPWPAMADGAPYLFAFQFRFVESSDILPFLPGDVLLVFLKEEYLVTGEDDFIVFEWQRLTNVPLVTEQECLAPRWPYFHGYGLRLRSFDFVDVTQVSEEYTRLAESMGCRLENDYAQGLLANSAARFGGVKVGGLPAWRSDCDTDSIYAESELLFGFSSIYPMWDLPYPFVNQSQPLTVAQACAAGNSLNWYDGFWFYVFLGATGDLQWGFRLD